MEIPTHWARAEGEATGPDGKRYALRLWGWSQDSVADALRAARQRVTDVAARIGRGSAEGEYGYGRQPLREEIIERVGAPGSRGEAIVTRNRYGALVLNTAQLPFVDVDSPPSLGFGWLGRLFGRAPRPDPTLEAIRAACQRHARNAFRIYRTPAGYRVLAIDRFLDPGTERARDFLAGFGADPYFVKLCGLQRSFRARLTPKPFRCGCLNPPGRHPREDPEDQRAFDAWRVTYERASSGFAACRLLETVGSCRVSADARPIVELHDRVCRAESDLPLA